MRLGNRRTTASVVAALVVVAGLVWTGPGSAATPVPAVLPPGTPSVGPEVPGVVTDPNATNGRVLVMDISDSWYDGSAARTATWQLSNSTGTVVIGPKPLSLGQPTPQYTRFPFNPTAENGGVALPDGTYSFSISVTYDDGTDSDTRTAATDVKLAQAPPPAGTPEAVFSRPDVHPGVRPAHAGAVALPDTGHDVDSGDPPATMTVTTVGGAPVAQVDGFQDCVCDDNTSDSYQFEWDGTTTPARPSPRVGTPPPSRSPTPGPGS
jgi:hypothetical protein